MSKIIRYPRRVLIRQSMRALGRLLARLLAQVQIEGQQNFPTKGPLIVVGNHTAAMEVVLMTIYTPWILEYMGSTDIPHECFISAFMNSYGFIPVFRGNVERASLQAGLEVLSQDGMLGLFPEGGIWEPNIRQAQSGVAWLSYHAQAPVLPIGFGAMQGALARMFRFERPSVKMVVGPLLPPVQVEPGRPRKLQLQAAADRIMDAVWELIPPEDRQQEQVIQDERFELHLAAFDRQGQPVEIPVELQPAHGPALSKLIHRTVLINNFIQNLKLPVTALKYLADQPPLPELIQATESIQAYLEKDNPYYFTYRYGNREGKAMQAGVHEIQQLARWALAQGLQLKATPLRRFYVDNRADEIVLERPSEYDKW
ncbi:MAG: 1-acyl-sn-glycerol-3-phosphate acyltransferase [Anaerolineales bacterium]|nr:1-acyl-sn-glycerol-3-phosphate acyltransferase [Anaerolineales bacterium]